MCTETQLNEILQTVAVKSKEIFKEELHSVILYGSYARGDFDSESDVDIMILANVGSDKLLNFRKDIDSLCGSLLFDYGIVVSITERDVETYYKYVDILPFYQNIEREGVKFA